MLSTGDPHAVLLVFALKLVIAHTSVHWSHVDFEIQRDHTLLSVPLAQSWEGRVTADNQRHVGH